MFDVLQEANLTKRFLQSIGLASDEDSIEEMKSKAQDLCESVLKEYGLKYRKKQKKMDEDGHAYYYHFKWQGKKFVLLANVTFSLKHIRVSIWSDPTTKFYKVLGSSELKRYYPLKVYMMDQMEQFLSGDYKGDEQD